MTIEDPTDERRARAVRATDDDRQPGPLAVSVVTIVSGRRGHLEALGRGVARSAHRAHELVVVAIDEDSDPLPEAGEVRVRMLGIASAGGPIPLAAARNLAIESAESEYVLLLDVDCIPSAGLIGAVAATLDAEDAVAMAPVGYLPRGFAGPVSSELDDAALERHARYLRTRPRHPKRGEACDPRGLWSLAFAGRRSTLLERIGGFDPAYAGYGGEDTDLGMRAHRAGVPLVWSGPDPAYHQHHRTLSPPAQHLEPILRNARLFHQRWGFWPMEGWLAAFEDRGWIEWKPDGDRVRLLRLPTAGELSELEVD